MNSNQAFTLTGPMQNSAPHYLLQQRSGVIPRSIQAQSSNDGRTRKHSGNSRSPLIGRNQQRLNHSDFYGSQHKRGHPSLHALTHSEKEGYLAGLERAVLEENRNIKQHNNFLKQQIKVMFEREKKYKGSLQASKLRVRQLQGVNAILQSQLQTLISKIIGEIERIQRIIEEERWGNCEELLMISRSVADTPQKGMQLASETESTIHHNLEDLKVRVSNMAKYTPFDLSNDYLVIKPAATMSTNEKEELCKKTESILTQQNSAKEANLLPNEKQDIFQAYLPTKLITNDTRVRDKRNAHRKN